MKSFSLNHLSDFKAIAESILTKEERESLLKNPQFFYAPDRNNYQLIQDHSEYVDKILGFKVDEIETKLKSMAQILNPEGCTASWGKMMHEGSQSWVGLNPRQLLTPYNELSEMCEIIRPMSGSTLVDLGAGYARMGYVLNSFSAECNFIGYEIVKERVDESLRLIHQDKLDHAQMYTEDLSSEDFQIPVADFYLIYDYGTVEHIRKTLEELQQIAFHHPIKVIGRGKIRHYIQTEHPWLSQVYDAHHELTFSVYSSF